MSRRHSAADPADPAEVKKPRQRRIQTYLGMRLPDPIDEAQELGLAELRGVGRSLGAVGWRSLGARRACSRSTIGAAIQCLAVTDSCLCDASPSTVPGQVELVAAAIVAAGAVEGLFRLAPELHRLGAPLQVLLEPRERDGAAEHSRRSSSRWPSFASSRSAFGLPAALVLRMATHCVGSTGQATRVTAPEGSLRRWCAQNAESRTGGNLHGLRSFSTNAQCAGCSGGASGMPCMRAWRRGVNSSLHAAA